MVSGLQIHISGEELIERVSERVRAHEATIGALDARIREREGDQPFDVRPEDGFKTLGELDGERQHYRDRLTHLTMLRNNLLPGEMYALKKSDLRLAELISPIGRASGFISAGLQKASIGSVRDTRTASPLSSVSRYRLPATSYWLSSYRLSRRSDFTYHSRHAAA
jgi:hypothetical protein